MKNTQIPAANNDKILERFIDRWEEVTEIPPQKVGRLTPLYKRAIPYFKFAPWRVIIPLTIVIVAAFFFLLDITSISLASLLQKGF